MKNSRKKTKIFEKVSFLSNLKTWQASHTHADTHQYNLTTFFTNWTSILWINFAFVLESFEFVIVESNYSFENNQITVSGLTKKQSMGNTKICAQTPWHRLGSREILERSLPKKTFYFRYCVWVVQLENELVEVRIRNFFFLLLVLCAKKQWFSVVWMFQWLSAMKCLKIAIKIEILGRKLFHSNSYFKF